MPKIDPAEKKGMINILSVKCGLAFAPYLYECARSFLLDQQPHARVIRQGGAGLIIRTGEEFFVRHQNRETALLRAEVAHYSETLGLRIEYFDVRRTSDELVFANTGTNLFLSYPQSEMWLEAATVARLIEIFNRPDATADDEINDSLSLPDWLNVSSSAGRLLVSDQRNGRWSLLSRDHIAEFERRLAVLNRADDLPVPKRPPTISVKGVIVHLQSAFRLADVLESFARSGEVSAFEETAPSFELKVSKSIEGIELRDSDNRVGITRREAGKWAAIVKSELARLNASSLDRGRIRTVFAEGEKGRWVMQWGDEIFIPADMLEELAAGEPPSRLNDQGSLVAKRSNDFLLLLSAVDGSCVALAYDEVEMLLRP